MIENVFELSKKSEAIWYKVVARHDRTGDMFHTFLVKALNKESIEERFDHWDYHIWTTLEVQKDGYTEDWTYEANKGLYKARHVLIWYELYGPLPHISDPKLWQEVNQIMESRLEAERQEIFNILKVQN
jgi:hypothetical protein